MKVSFHLRRDSPVLTCGLYETDITPPLGFAIPGYFTPRPAIGIKDPLYAKAIVIGNDESLLAIIGLDTIGIEKEEVQAIRHLVTEATGIPASHILVAATHTHTGGPIYRDRGSDGDEYTAYLVKKAADTAVMAFGLRQPARIGFAKGEEKGLSFNRRFFMKNGGFRTNPGFNNPEIDRPAGPIDPEVAVIRIDAEDGSPLGVLASFACHPDTIGGMRYSADYPGELSRVLKAVYGNAFVSLFLNGACGNINHLDFLNGTKPGPDVYKKMGRVLAGEVMKTRERAEYDEDLSLEGYSKSLLLTVRKPSQEELDRSQSVIERASSEVKDEAITEADVFFAKQILTLQRRAEWETTVEMQALRIGSTSIAAFPCELFVEFGQEIKAKSPFAQTIVATYANGVNGYVATREAFTQGGYETRLTSRTRLAPDSGEKMVETLRGLLNELY